MTKNSAAKQAIRTLMEWEGIPYSEAKRRIAAPCDHYLMVGSGYDGEESIFCGECGLPAEVISGDDAENLLLDCEVHYLNEARATGHVSSCMNSYPIGDEGDGSGPLAMSCEMEYAGWDD